MNDQYLILGRACMCLDKSSLVATYKEVSFFHSYIIRGGKKYPAFKQPYQKYPLCWRKYRPIGTEWDFAPDWAVCSTVDYYGCISFWDRSCCIPNKNEGRFFSQEYDFETSHFICPDKTRYEDGAWIDSLRMRPEWAKEIARCYTE